MLSQITQRFHSLFHKKPPPPPAIPVLPAGVWQALPANVLLQAHERLLSQIRNLAGTPDDYWKLLYQPLIDNFTLFVQQTPASEAHHHCYQGGMLAHSLQVMKLALEARKGKMLPSGAAAEEANRQQHAWTFAIASAALLHDVGKPCSDQRLRLFNADGSDTLKYWQPLQGALPVGTYYRVEFVRDRQYRTHELLPPLLARQLTPPAALSWLQQDFPAVFKAWLGYLSGQDEVAGLLGVIVTEADMLSVAEDLVGSPAIHTHQLPTAKAKPLSQRLLTGLRFLLDNNQIPLNRPGAAAFFDGDSLWLMSKRVLDDLRNHLEKEGQTGIPSRNDRLMDELQQHGILTPTASSQAIWNATVKAGSMEQAFTLLRIPASHLWADPAQYPPILDGSIIVNSKDTTTAKPSTATTTPESSPQASTLQAVSVAAIQPAATVPESSATIPATVVETTATAITAIPNTGTTEATDDSWMLPFDTHTPATAETDVGVIATANFEENPWGDAPPTASSIETLVSPTKTTKGNKTNAPTPANHPATQNTIEEDDDDTGKRFLEWLSDGLRKGIHPLNTTEAFLHTTKEGLLVVSPRAFKTFSEHNWEYVQKRFTKLKLHKPAPNNSNIWLYHVRGQKKSGAIRGFLLEKPVEKLGVAFLPTPNKSIQLPEQ